MQWLQDRRPLHIKADKRDEFSILALPRLVGVDARMHTLKLWSPGGFLVQAQGLSEDEVAAAANVAAQAAAASSELMEKDRSHLGASHTLMIILYASQWVAGSV